jgi:hypothetical protein
MIFKVVVKESSIEVRGAYFEALDDGRLFLYNEGNDCIAVFNIGEWLYVVGDEEIDLP